MPKLSLKTDTKAHDMLFAPFHIKKNRNNKTLLRKKITVDLCTFSKNYIPEIKDGVDYLSICREILLKNYCTSRKKRSYTRTKWKNLKITKYQYKKIEQNLILQKLLNDGERDVNKLSNLTNFSILTIKNRIKEFDMFGKLILHRVSKKNKLNNTEIESSLYKILESEDKAFYTSSLIKNEIRKEFRINCCNKTIRKKIKKMGYVYKKIVSIKNKKKWKYIPKSELKYKGQQILEILRDQDILFVAIDE